MNENTNSYIEIKQRNKDVLFILKSDRKQVIARMLYWACTETYAGIELSFLTESADMIKHNPWLLELDACDVRDWCAKHGFEVREPSYLEKLIHSN